MFVSLSEDDVDFGGNSSQSEMESDPGAISSNTKMDTDKMDTAPTAVGQRSDAHMHRRMFFRLKCGPVVGRQVVVYKGKVYRGPAVIRPSTNRHSRHPNVIKALQMYRLNWYISEHHHTRT